MNIFAPIAALAAFIFFLHRRMRRYLHVFQQDEYDNKRFLRWIVETRTVDIRLSAVLLLVLAASLVMAATLPPWLWLVLDAAVFLAFGFSEPDPTRSGKKPLVLTKRAKLLLATALGVGTIAGALVTLFAADWGWLVAVQVPPLLLVVANLILKPVEKRTQAYYWKQAHERLLEIAPTVIGVTGSFGKTSVKHALGHVLELHSKAFVTPGSINTSMGIARVIRELLPPGCRYFVVEMGAYGPGSIETLCKLTPPRVGIITAIGEAHYERFKSIDNVVRAKFELASAALAAPDGFVIVHADVLQHPLAAQLVNNQRSRFIVCGQDPTCDVIIRSWSQSAAGLTISLVWRNSDYLIEAPIFGLHNVGNLSLVFATAVSVGVPPEAVAVALRKVPQTKHRLEVKRQGDGSILIDDAYNSNPAGFAAALELLTVLAEGKRRKILVTPGMVELGERHDELHTRLGALAAEHADVAIVVSSERIPTFVESFRRARQNANDIVLVKSFDEARAWLSSSLHPGDVVLLENDLPDLYESKLRL